MSITNKPEQGNPDAVTEPVDEIPENLQGKSAAELADMYQSLERKLGEQSGELGELRRALNQQQAPQPQQEAEAEVDFYSDPERYIRQVIAKELRPVASVVEGQQAKETERRLDAEFSGWKDTVKNSDFQSWVKKSKVRLNLWAQADVGDYDSAAELFSTWNDISGTAVKSQQKVEKAVQKDRKLRAARTEKGAPQIDGRQILKRVDLQELKRVNPDKYNALGPEIRKAYAEGRVK